MENIILYTIGCPQCKMLEAKLDAKGIKYEKCEDQNLMADKGFKSAPVLEVNGEIMPVRKALKWVNDHD